MVVTQIITEFSNGLNFPYEPNFPYELIRRFGNGYKRAEKYEEAIRLYRIAEGFRPADGAGTEANLQMAVALYKLAERSGDRAKYEEAREIFQAVLAEAEPFSRRSRFARKRLAFTEIKLDNDTGAQAAYDKLCTDLADDANNLPLAMFNIAARYGSEGKYEKAESIYQQIMSQYPNHPKAILAPLIIRKNQILVLIEQGNDAAAHAAIEQMESDFASHPGLSTPLLYIAEKYYENAFKNEDDVNSLSNCAIVYEKVINDYLDITKPVYLPDAYRCTADCYRRLGEYQKAIGYYQKVVDDGPEYKYAWYAPFAIGRILEGRKADGAIKASEADPQIRAAYEQVVSNYPNCPVAGYAKKWLRKNINSN
jgi:tetratricopeptide (TPR) repeat protein